MYEHDVVEHLLLYCSTASTVEHSAINLHEAAKQVRADKSASASKQTDSIYVLYCSSSTSSTAQHSAISPHKAAKQVRAHQSATTQASRQSWRVPAHVVGHLYRTLNSLNERRH